MLPLHTYLRLTRASALYDIIVIAPFATPWTFAHFYAQLSHLNQWLGAGPLPGFETIHLLLAILLGTLVLTWSVFRLITPSLKLGRFDATARLVFSLWLAWAMLQDPLPMLWLFLIPELLWGAVQWWPIGSSTSRAAFTSAVPMRSSRGG
ncbi:MULTISPECIES: hypothetical protein [unclassified Massilia]|uniref:hypothetical protein n=1 Tax=unclassified Massilia TaxID=2609279 RepID=UPI001B810FCE|nr:MULTISPECIES: hypothetical protein [unclassified Massilia]MBQ5938773.1 hypothetical protein [Massilia sp. AB1]MBQ5962238.1 hypothetical protein [Massilia sp. ZL223]